MSPFTVSKKNKCKLKHKDDVFLGEIKVGIIRIYSLKKEGVWGTAESDDSGGSSYGQCL